MPVFDTNEFPEIRPAPFLVMPDDCAEFGRGERSDSRAESRPLGINATPFVWRDPEALPRRRWVYGSHYIRRFVSATVAPGGVGKTALAAIEALAIATNRNLLNVKPVEQTNVWLWNGEDPLEEMQRRIMAACMHYNIKKQEIDGRLFVDSGRDTEITIAEQTKSGATINAPAVEQIISTIRKNNIGVLIIDPFVSSHRVTENDNTAIDRVAKTWAQIAEKTNCAIDLVHHSRKTGGAEVTVEDSRGAVALLGAARSARVLNGMSPDEAEKADVENRRLYFRVENGKANLTAALETATWHKLKSVDLGNGPDRFTGDSVGVVTAWQWPDPFANMTIDDLRAAQKEVAAAGLWRENSQARDWVGIPIARALKLDPNSRAHKRKITTILKKWMESGMFVRVVATDPKRREEKAFVEVGEWA